jgi:hypothetical protein
MTPHAIVLALFLAGGGLCEAAGPQDLDRQVQEIIDRYFIGVGAERRREYALKVRVSLRQCRSPKQASELMEALPQLADSYASSVADYKRMLPNLDQHRDLVLKGFDLFADQMAGVVARAARRDPSEASHHRMVQQIEGIVAEARQVLTERIRGPAAAKYVDGELGRLRESWIRSLDSPFHAVIDTPLTAEEYAQVLLEMRQVAQVFTPVMLTDDDLLNRERLRETGVEDLAARVREKAHLASTLCYKDQGDSADREREWISQVKAKVREHQRQLARAEAQGRPSTSFSEGSAAPSPTDPPPPDAAPPGKKSGAADKKDGAVPESSLHESSTSIVGVAILLVVFLIGVAAVRRTKVRRERGQG